MTWTMGMPYLRANSQSRWSWPGTDITAPEPYSISTKLATHTGSASPVSGWVTVSPVGTPSFSRVAMSASAVFMLRHLSTKAATSGLRSAARRAMGCSAATAT